MKTAFLLCIALLVSSGLAQDNETSTEAPTSTTTSPTSSTTVSTTTTTTPESTTTSTKTSTITTSASTTTTAPPPTVGPDDHPKTPGVYNYSNNNNTYCIIASMSLTMNFTYKLNNNESANVYFALPTGENQTHTTGHCGNGSSHPAQLNIGFFDGWMLKLELHQEEKQYYVKEISVMFLANNSFFRNITNPSDDPITTTASNLTFDKVGNSKVFRCNSEESVKDFKSSNEKFVKLNSITTYDVTISAFQEKKDATDQNDWSYCEADTKINNIVPIVVGAALAGLVVIVLIAYLIGRRRRMSGYESV